MLRSVWPSHLHNLRATPLWNFTLSFCLLCVRVCVCASLSSLSLSLSAGLKSRLPNLTSPTEPLSRRKKTLPRCSAPKGQLCFISCCIVGNIWALKKNNNKACVNHMRLFLSAVFQILIWMWLRVTIANSGFSVHIALSLHIFVVDPDFVCCKLVLLWTSSTVSPHQN